MSKTALYTLPKDTRHFIVLSSLRGISILFEFVASVSVVGLFALFLLRLYRQWKAKVCNEPPLIPYWIPYIGNAIAFGINQTKLFASASSVSPEKRIASMTLMGHRVYVVTRTKDVAAVYRAQELQFEPMIVWGLGTMFGLSKEAQSLLEKEPCGPNSSLIFQSNPFFHRVLSKGEDLDTFSERFLFSIMDQLNLLENTIHSSPNQRLEVDLIQWVRTCIGTATTTAFLGPEFLLHTPDLLKWNWKFESDISTFQSQYPRMMAREAYQNRERLIQVFLNAYKARDADLKDAVWWLRQAQIMSADGGMKDRDIAIMTLGTWTATANNNNLMAFWFVLNCVLHPGLVDSLRQETGKSLDTPLDMDRIAQRPLLSSVLNETMRHYSTASSNRRATKDVVIAGYTLRKGSVVMCPVQLHHFDVVVWGEDAKEFVPTRFVREEWKGDENLIRPFGGGKSLCPGRFFAINSITAFTALLLDKFNIIVAAEQTIPTVSKSASNIGVGVPTNDVKAVIQCRKA
ncbi:cytochrome P450 [Gymnopus androsaceus JB14]|uniref:Cytochrome P450 n=1 Tax=Gymnopus androsaceus JB14 TaxID=1447944 RepID=A0A6A4GUH1_9AGAR|nr:cytochrome P450 [Gymnopus androsaceus JB14]